MSRKLSDNTVKIIFDAPADTKQKLTLLAIKKSSERGKRVTNAGLLRELIEREYKAEEAK